MAEYERAQRLQEIWRKRFDAASWQNATGAEFERLVAGWFRSQGYHVMLCGGAGDGGVDLTVVKGSENAIVQCKAYAKPLVPAVVRELWGTMQHLRQGKAYLATLNGISNSASQWADGKPIVVLTLNDFLREDSLNSVRNFPGA